MQLDWTISIGVMIQTITLIIAIIAGWNAFNSKLILLENIVSNHTKSLIEHSKRIDKYEERTIELVGDIQRLIGIVDRRREE